MIKEVPSLKKISIQEMINSMFNYKISYRKAWKTKQKAITIECDDWDESYAKLLSWLKYMQNHSLGSYILSNLSQWFCCWEYCDSWTPSVSLRILDFRSICGGFLVLQVNHTSWRHIFIWEVPWDVVNCNITRWKWWCSSFYIRRGWRRNINNVVMIFVTLVWTFDR